MTANRKWAIVGAASAVVDDVVLDAVIVGDDAFDSDAGAVGGDVIVAVAARRSKS